jgi:hypothetical protein
MELTYTTSKTFGTFHMALQDLEERSCDGAQAFNGNASHREPTMSKLSTFSTGYRQSSCFLAAGVIIMMTSASPVLSKPAEQLASNQSATGEQAAMLPSDAIVTGSAAPGDCSAVTNNTACHPENRPLPIQSLGFGGPR